jgi:hypothetical protein
VLQLPTQTHNPTLPALRPSSPLQATSYALPSYGSPQAPLPLAPDLLSQIRRFEIELERENRGVSCSGSPPESGSADRKHRENDADEPLPIQGRDRDPPRDHDALSGKHAGEQHALFLSLIRTESEVPHAVRSLRGISREVIEIAAVASLVFLLARCTPWVVRCGLSNEFGALQEVITQGGLERGT